MANARAHTGAKHSYGLKSVAEMWDGKARWQTSADGSSGLKQVEGVSVAKEGGQRAQTST